MSQPHDPSPAKLMASLFSPEEDLVDQVVQELAEILGPLDWVSPPLMFDRTRYYAREMGWPLHRRFVAASELVPPERLVDIKLRTNLLEEQYTLEGQRRINIDPGYLTAERLILATGKNYLHRVYLGRGIFADLTLLFKRGSFVPLPWTYPDYAEPSLIAMLNALRARYMEQLKEMRRID